MKGSESSKGIIGFDYQGSMTGSIELMLIKADKYWKIDAVGMPKFDKLPRLQENTDQ